MSSTPRALFISHGGGPLPLLGDPGHKEMVACLKQLAAELPRPDAILVVSAHWEEKLPTLTAAAQPELIYDYYGFPPETYEITYPCPGLPELAEEVCQRLQTEGMNAALDTQRGLDHGVFVPLKIMYPDADIPCVQLSLVNTLDAATHIRMGQALAGLAQKNVLVVGSGFSFHNLNAFFNPQVEEYNQDNRVFEDWLQTTCTSQELSEAERYQRLVAWSQAPGAATCHPREEHLLPLHVCYGAAHAASVKSYSLTVMNKRSSIYLW